MSLLFDLFKAYSIGVFLFAAVPVVVFPLSWRTKKGLIQTYTGMAMHIIGRGLLLQREHGGLKLVRTKFDTRLGSGAELARIGGEIKHWKDPENLMSTLHGRPFGLAHEAKNVIVDARMCRAGRLERELEEMGERVREFDGSRYYKAFFNITNERPLVDINDAMPLVQGSGDPGLPDRIETYVEKGNLDYNSRQMLQGVKFLTTFGGVFLLMWLGRKLMETTSGGSTLIPGVIF